jgi:competence protein ComEC
VPLIAIAVAAYAAGLIAGFRIGGAWAVAASGGATVVALLVTARRSGRPATAAACALVFAVGTAVAHDARSAPDPPTGLGAPQFRGTSADMSVLARWRGSAGATIDTLFGANAPMVRALLIADTRQVSTDVRDRYARSGLVHVLSISGLHVAIIAGAVVLALQMLRVPPAQARWLAVALTALYVAAIGAPAPALRSGAMLAASALARALQRPTSPWATLALGALVPLLLDPRTVLDLGYQLSVTGFAALTAATIWARRALPAELRGFRRTLVTDLIISAVATLATAPLVAWHFARVSLIAPLTNLVAAPVVAVMQPALFLALVLAPTGAPARLAADGAGVLVRTLDAIAAGGAAMPGASLTVAPSLPTALLGGAGVACVLAAAAARRRRAQWGVAGAAAVAAMIWWPLAPGPARGMEVHLIDVGQGDAIAVRTPAGRWIVVDAGGGRGGGDAGRRVVAPYLRRLGGDVALFVMTHPHDDHVGGAAWLVSVLRPADVRDAAFAGTSPSYRDALVAVRSAGVPWRRVRPGDSVNVDGVVATFLAPDSAWTASLTDPNLASAVVRVRYGRVRVLLTGDAEAPEEAWLLARGSGALAADVLKVAHHGSATSTTDDFLDAVRPSLALISAGRHNRYNHPSPRVLAALAARGIRVARTDRDGTVVVRTDRDGRNIATVDLRRAR